MKKQGLIVIAVALTMVMFAGTAFSGNYGCSKKQKAKSGHYGSNAGCGQSQEWANLTEKQQTDLKAIRQKFIDETAETRVSMLAKRQEIAILMETSSPDRARLIKLSEQMSDLQKTIKIRSIDYILEAKKIAPGFKMPMKSHKFGKFGKMGMGSGNKGCPRLQGQGNGNPDNS